MEYFRGKKITVMGLGLLGRGIGDVKFIAEQGAELIVTDLKPASELTSALESLKNLPITFHLGGHDLADFRGRDYILKAGGVPLDSIYITEARQNHIPIKMSESWFAELAPVTTIGITGTRGKSTVTQLIYEILKAANKQVFLGGNVRGVSTLSLLREVAAGDLVVMELDSWRLQGFGEAKISPQVAVFTNFLPDHLNYYHGDLEIYFADKANVFKYQKPGDILICGAGVAPRLGVVPASDLPADWVLKIPGEHNRQNAALAKAATEALQLDPDLIKTVITNFSGVPGRLELIRDWRGIKIYNDTTSTTPDALAAALTALGSGERNLILIMGGADKNLSFDRVTPLVNQYCREVILLPGTGTAKLKLAGRLVNNLSEAVSQATSKAQAGDVILFSPGFASFGLFKNEFDRGDQFSRAILAL